MNLGIIGTGAKQPKLVVTNDDLTKIGDTNDEWIRTRTGICERRILTDDTLEDLAIAASKEALASSGKAAEDIDLIVVATFTPTNFTPNMACFLKKELGAKNAVAFDLNSACSGFVYSVWVAKNIMDAQGLKNALIVGSDALSKVTNWDDRSTFVLFGDGAGAAIMSAVDAGGILAMEVKNYDDDGASLGVNGLDVGTPFFESDKYEKSVTRMEGAAVFRFATAACAEIMEKLAAKAGKKLSEIQHFVPHQANGRIVDHVAAKLGIPIERFFKNMDKYGNTSAASVPMAMHEMFVARKPKKGDLVMAMAFGGGLTAGGFLFEI
ncbi:3-oxoacyl-[acyl-carrier-protein] synthase 3 [Clostridia bacterium]|nr:3-oxoacyl-[acyl-carrier-protein] synthase 3 [Clostridia bacterium]